MHVTGMGFLLCVIANPNIMSCLCEGVPRDVKPTIAGKKLVGIGASLQESHQTLELRRVFRTDIGSLAQQVLRVADTTHFAIHIIITKARIDDDRPNLFTGWFQQQVTAVGQVYHILHCGNVLWVLAQIEELAQLKVRRDEDIIYLCFHGNVY